MEILRSVKRRRAAPPKPHLGHQAGGAGSLGAKRRMELDDTTALVAAECQSFLDNIVASLGQTRTELQMIGSPLRGQYRRP